MALHDDTADHRMTPAKLVQIADRAIADAVARSGEWLACRPGCSQCCVGVFAISTLDRDRLREGLTALTASDPARAEAVRSRTAASVARLAPWFPGDAATGILGESEEAIELFEEFANDEVCPALDPATGTCDLYSARPMLCRTFGPPMPSGDGLAVCELCFIGATAEETSRSAIDASFVALEEQLLAERGESGAGSTIVAFALAD